MYLLHGDDTISSRRRLSELTSHTSLAAYMYGDKTNFSEVLNALSVNDMFETEKCVVIEQISKLGKSDLDKVLPVFEKVAKDKQTTLILWQGNEMTKLQTGKFKNAVIESFMLPKLFFTFLDNFTPHSLQLELKTLSQMTNIDEMQIFYALIKRIRLLLMIKSGGDFEELLKMNPWQLNKLKAQSAKFKVEELEYIYSQLFVLEKDLKSGGLMLPLKKHLDILITGALN